MLIVPLDTASLVQDDQLMTLTLLRYQDHSLPVTPILPAGSSGSATEVEGLAVSTDPVRLTDFSCSLLHTARWESGS